MEWRQELADALGCVGRDGYFACCASHALAAVPQVVVQGVGVLTLPLQPQQATKLLSAGAPAPYGKGTATVLDPEVRRALQIDASRVALSPSWSATLKEITALAVTALGVESSIGVEARLYKLLVYEPGGHFRMHRDTEKEPGMFATLIVQLPVVGGHEGGALEVMHEGQKLVWDSSKNSSPGNKGFVGTPTPSNDVTSAALASSCNLQYAAFYADCEHCLAPITAGVRLVLAYNLVRTATAAPTLTPPRNKHAMAGITVALLSWIAALDAAPMSRPTAAAAADAPSSTKAAALKAVAAMGDDADDGAGFPDPVAVACPALTAFPLEHRYSPTSLSFEGLKGRDAELVRLLQATGLLDVQLALVKRQVSGSGDIEYGGDYHSDTGQEEYDMEEEYNEEFSTHGWSAPLGAAVEFELMMKQKGTVISALGGGHLLGEWTSDIPDEQSYEGYSGNEGPSVEHIYYKAVVVMWPRSHCVNMLTSLGPGMFNRAAQLLSQRLHQFANAMRALVMGDIKSAALEMAADAAVPPSATVEGATCLEAAATKAVEEAMAKNKAVEEVLAIGALFPDSVPQVAEAMQAFTSLMSMLYFKVRRSPSECFPESLGKGFYREESDIDLERGIIIALVVLGHASTFASKTSEGESVAIEKSARSAAAVRDAGATNTAGIIGQTTDGSPQLSSSALTDCMAPHSSPSAASQAGSPPCTSNHKEDASTGNLQEGGSSASKKLAADAMCAGNSKAGCGGENISGGMQALGHLARDTVAEVLTALGKTVGIQTAAIAKQLASAAADMPCSSVHDALTTLVAKASARGQIVRCVDVLEAEPFASPRWQGLRTRLADAVVESVMGLHGRGGNTNAAEGGGVVGQQLGSSSPQLSGVASSSRADSVPGTTATAAEQHLLRCVSVEHVSAFARLICDGCGGAVPWEQYGACLDSFVSAVLARESGWASQTVSQRGFRRGFNSEASEPVLSDLLKLPAVQTKVAVDVRLRPLLLARVQQLEADVKKAPEFSWKMKEAKFESNDEVAHFLHGPEESATFSFFSNAHHAHNWAIKHFGVLKRMLRLGYSAEADPGILVAVAGSKVDTEVDRATSMDEDKLSGSSEGIDIELEGEGSIQKSAASKPKNPETGDGVSCKVTKTRELFKSQYTSYHENLEELQSLQFMVMASNELLCGNT